MKQIQHLLALVLFVLLSTAFTACKSTSAVLPTKTTDSTTTKIVTTEIHDTVFKTQKDSSYYKAYIECVNGKPVIIQKSKDESHKGKYVAVPKVNLTDSQLRVDCEVAAQEYFAKWKDTYIKEHKQITIRIPYPVETPLSWWQHTRIIAGNVFLSLLALACIAGALRLLKFI